MQPNPSNNVVGKRTDAGNARQRGGVERLLVAYDGSAGADAALADLARAGLPDALEAIVLSVAEWTRPEVVGRFVRQTRPAQQVVSRAAESWSHLLAEQACTRLRSSFPGWNVEPRAVVDFPAWGIVGRAAEWKADLVVTGAHGQSCCERMLLGSVARRAFADVSCSIRIARPSHHPAGSSLRILVAVDGSFADEAVIEAVVARAWSATTEFQVVTVLDSRPDAARASTQFLASELKHRHSAEADARAHRLVEKCQNRFRGAGLRVDPRSFAQDFARTLAAQTKAWEADCLFLGMQGRGGRRGGSLWERTVFAAAACASCSVEVVKPKEQTAPVEERRTADIQTHAHRRRARP